MAWVTAIEKGKEVEKMKLHGAALMLFAAALVCALMSRPTEAKDETMTIVAFGDSITEAVARASVSLTEDARSKFIVAATMSGNTARMIAKYRPNKNIIAVTESERAASRLCLTWGVIPHVFHFESNTEMLRGLGTKLIEIQHAEAGDIITVVSGRHKGKMGGTNIIRLYNVE